MSTRLSPPPAPLQARPKASTAKLYAVSFDGLRATEMRTIVEAAMYIGETRVSRSVQYSIESYAAANKTELCLSMIAYGDSANAFFSN